jgi:predicted nucleic acid-binding protein
VSDAWVIDSSVGIAWVHPHQATEETEKLLEEVAEGAIPVIPRLWFAEVANALLVLQRRKKITAPERATALLTLSALNLTIDDEAEQAAFTRASELAERHGLSVYDAIYAELALRRRLPLASLDKTPRAAAKSLGVKLL